MAFEPQSIADKIAAHAAPPQTGAAAPASGASDEQPANAAAPTDQSQTASQGENAGSQTPAGSLPPAATGDAATQTLDGQAKNDGAEEGPTSQAFASMRVKLDGIQDALKPVGGIEGFHNIVEPLGGVENVRELLDGLAGADLNESYGQTAAGMINKHLGEARYSALANYFLVRHTPAYVDMVLQSPDLLNLHPLGKEFVIWKQNGGYIDYGEDAQTGNQPPAYTDTSKSAQQPDMQGLPQWAIDELKASRTDREQRQQHDTQTTYQTQVDEFNQGLIAVANSSLQAAKFSTDETEDARIKRNVLASCMNRLVEEKAGDIDKAQEAMKQKDKVAVRSHQTQMKFRLRQLLDEEIAFESRRSTRPVIAEENLRQAGERQELPNVGAAAPKPATAVQDTRRAFDPNRIAERATANTPNARRM